jgi:hypothetical protein
VWNRRAFVVQVIAERTKNRFCDRHPPVMPAVTFHHDQAPVADLHIR